MGLSTYRRKRDFAATSEPRGKAKARARGDSFVVHKHAARQLHYDFRLEHRGVLMSWAVPRGVPMKPGERRLAVRTEDHPLEYGGFEGVIPKGQYGGGTVMLWDRGTWKSLGDTAKDIARGSLSFELHGERLRGRWTLTRMQGRAGDDGDNWLLIKRSNAAGSAKPKRPDVTVSVATARTMDRIARDADRSWSSGVETRVRKTVRKTRAPSSTKRVTAGFVAAMPKTLAPQLATLVERVPQGDEWLHELKYDGYRLIAFKRDASVRLITRSGLDWSVRFPTLVAALAKLPARNAIIDGEVTVLSAGGASDFQALQNSLDQDSPARHVYFAFDLPYVDGRDLRDTPLLERKRHLSALLSGARWTPLRYSDHVLGDGSAFHAGVCRRGLEGIVSKQSSAPYTSARTRSWLKIKCSRRQEFVVGGWSEPQGARAHFGALLLGVYESGALVYCGRVGAGFSVRSLAALGKALRSLEVARSPFATKLTGAEARDVHWARPRLVVEVEFKQWTADHHLRQPTFLGLREDKAPLEVRREQPRGVSASMKTTTRIKSHSKARSASPRRSASKSNSSIDDARLTHPERVLYPEPGITKRDLANYYIAIQDWVLPHVTDRPLSIVRCPDGQTGQRFFQKHLPNSAAGSLRGIDVGGEPYIAIDDLPGLLALVQMSALELHPWGSRGTDIDRPDRIVLDLDPDAAVGWPVVLETARALRKLLEREGLTSFVRTTGGKGLHVVVPLQGKTTWPHVKEFAKSIVTTLAREVPDLYVTKASKAARKGKIFLDYLRNDRGSTAVASYSTRATPQATVATPLRWDELKKTLDPKAFTVLSVPKRLARTRTDPWEGFSTLRQTLPRTASRVS